MHSLGWSIGFAHSGACMWKGYFCVCSIILAIAFECVARASFLSIRQSRGMVF